MSLLRLLFIVVWTVFVIYPNWGEWAVFLLAMGYAGPMALSLPLRPWLKAQTRAIKRRGHLTHTEFFQLAALALVPIFSVIGYLMYLSLTWFGFWCTVAIAVPFVSFSVERK